MQPYYLVYCALITVSFLLLPACGNKKKKLTKKEAIAKHETKKAESRPFAGKKIERLTFDEALAVYKYYKKQKKKPQLMATIERIITLTTDHDFIYPLLIELADLTFEAGDYKKAEEYYARHAAMYPGAQHRDYVITRQIESAYKQIVDVHRDQTKTKETKKLIEAYLPTISQNNPHRKQLEAMLDHCSLLLLESELNTINFYLHRFRAMNQKKALDAAYKRLQQVNTTLLPNIKTEQYHKAHQTLNEFFANENRTQDFATIETFMTQLRIPKNPVHMRNRF